MSVDSDSDGDSTASNTVQDLCLTPEEYEKFRLDPRSYLGLDDDSDEELDIQIVRDERRDQPSTLAPVNSTNVGANVKVTTAADAVLLGNNPTNNGSAAAAFAAASFDPSALLHNSQNEPPLESSLQIAFPTTKVLRNDTNIDDDENDFLMLDDDDADIDSMSCCSHNSTGIVDAATGNPSVDDAPAPLNASMQPLLGTKTVLPPLRDGTAAEVSDFTLLQAPANCSPQTGATVNQNTIPQGAPGQRRPRPPSSTASCKPPASTKNCTDTSTSCNDNLEQTNSKPELAAPKTIGVAQLTVRSRALLCKTLLDKCASSGVLENRTSREIAAQFEMTAWSVRAIWTQLCSSIVTSSDADTNSMTFELVLRQKCPLTNQSNTTFKMSHPAVPILRNVIATAKTAEPSKANATTTTTKTTEDQVASETFDAMDDVCLDLPSISCDNDMNDDASCASSSSGDTVAEDDFDPLNTTAPQAPITSSTHYPDESLPMKLQKELCCAILDRCLPNGAASDRNAPQEIAHHYRVPAECVYSMWKQVRASLTDDAATVKLFFQLKENPGHSRRQDIKLSLAHLILNRISAHRNNTAPSSVPPTDGTESVSLNATSAVGEESAIETVVSGRTCDGSTLSCTEPVTAEDLKSSTAQAEHPSPKFLPRRGHGHALTQESREIVCQALLDRCYSNGELAENAVWEISAQFQLNHNTVRMIWKCILASVTATGKIDPNFGKGNDRWHPYLDLDEAHAALQKVLPQKSRSAAPLRKLGRAVHRKRVGMCNALLDSCRPSGTLKPNALTDVAGLCHESKMTVYKTWKRMLLSVQETGEVDPNFNEGSKYHCPEINFDRAYTALQKVLAQRTKETAAALNDSVMSFAGKKYLNSRKTPARTAKADSPGVDSAMVVTDESSLGSTGLARNGKRLASGSHEIMCNAILDRCRPDGRLGRKALEELAGRLQVNYMTMYFMWKRMLASVVETGFVDPHFKKEGSKVWFPEVNREEARLALQKVLTQRKGPGSCQLDESTIDATAPKKKQRGMNYAATTKKNCRAESSGLALPRHGVHLAKGSHDVMCNAILNRCKSDGTLESKALGELASQLEVTYMTVYTTWRRMLASVVETGVIDPLFKKEGSKPYFPEINVNKARIAMQKVVGQRKGSRACHVDESIADATTAKTPVMALPRTSTGVHLAEGSHEIICNAILDRCRPDGTLEKAALRELSDQLHVNRTTVYTMWKRILASVVETGMVDPHFTKKGAKAWFPEVNIEEACSALQTVLEERQKGAYAMPGTDSQEKRHSTAFDSTEESPFDTSTNSNSLRSSSSCPVAHGDFLAPLDSAVEFLSRKYSQEHLCDQDAFRADVHVRVTLNHIYFLVGPGKCILQRQGNEKDGAVNLYLCHNFNVHDTRCNLFLIHVNDGTTKDISESNRLCSNCACQTEQGNQDMITTENCVEGVVVPDLSVQQHEHAPAPKRRKCSDSDSSQLAEESHCREEEWEL